MNVVMKMTVIAQNKIIKLSNGRLSTYSNRCRSIMTNFFEIGYDIQLSTKITIH